MPDDDTVKLNINIFSPGEKTAELRCNWCGLIHPVEPAYREHRLKRGAEMLEEMLERDDLTEDQRSQLEALKPEDTWTCGCCYKELHDLPDELKDRITTECEHPVPDKKWDH